MTQITENFTVSAKLICGEEAEVIAEMMQENYPDVVVEDHDSYLSLTADGKPLVFDMGKICEALGHSYRISNFLAILASYKGEIDVGDDSVTIKVFAPTNDHKTCGVDA